MLFSVNEKRNKHKVDLSSQSEVKNESRSTTVGMDHEEFRRCGKEMIDYIADYLTHIRLENSCFSSICFYL